MLKSLPLSVRHTFHYDLKAAMLFGVFGGAFLPFIAIVGRKIGATEFQIALLMAAPYIANTLRFSGQRIYSGKAGSGMLCGPMLQAGLCSLPYFLLQTRLITR